MKKVVLFGVFLWLLGLTFSTAQACEEHEKEKHQASREAKTVCKEKGLTPGSDTFKACMKVEKAEHKEQLEAKKDQKKSG